MSEGFGAGFDGLSDDTGELAGEIARATREMREMEREAERLSRAIGSGLRTAFDRAIFGGKGLGETLKGLAGDVASRTLRQAVQPVTSGLSSALAGALGSAGGAFAGLLGFEKGGAFSAGRVRAFAKGGVVGGPTLFPMAGGTGLMGEAGPEAIMPLARGADGRLGVRSEGRGGVPVVVNIQTPDAESFRRSRGQVSAQLARAVARGRGRT